MSIRVMSAVWAIALPDSEKLVMLALADWSDDDGKCWPIDPTHWMPLPAAPGPADGESK